MILDTFYVLFKSNSDDLKKGGEEAVKTTDKVEKKLKEAETASTHLGSSFAGMIARASGAITALFSVGAVIGGIKAAAEYANTIGQLSAVLGYSSEALDSWGGAVTRAGGDAQTFYSTISSMDKSLKEIGKTGSGEAAQTFRKLGIRIKDAGGNVKSFIDLLPEIANKFEGLSKSKSDSLGAKLGLDQGTIMLLQKGGKEVQTLIAREKELGVVTKEQTEVSRKFKIQQQDTSHAFRSLFASYITDIIPIFEKSYKSLEGFAVLARKHKDFILGAIGAISAIILTRMIPAVISLTAAMLTNPAVWLAAAILAVGVAFGIVYEDIQKFKAGHDSLIGRAFKKWPEFEKVIRAIGKAFSYAAEKLGEFEDFLNSGGFTINPLKIIDTVIQRIVDGLKAGWQLWKQFSGAISEGFEAGKFLFDLVTGKDSKNSTSNGVANGINSFDKSPLSNQSSTAISNGAQTKNNTNNITVGPTTINTQATDPNAIASAFTQSLTKQTNFAANNLSSGRVA